ncbi:hypothetical protein BDW22DRAFT_1133000 [Trametopsis cervina]|nr:hypothetical protein BDW22DRAFT_1133000 [Trametopsis cervina]
MLCKPLTLTVALALAATYATAAPAIVCAVCPSTIFFSGQTRKLTLSREESGDLQCNYDTPAISGFSPTCLYANNGGILLETNAGTACPSVAATKTETSSFCTA